MRLETFQQEGSGAIGIRHEAFSATQFPDLDQSGLIVVETFPGFPGHRTAATRRLDFGNRCPTICVTTFRPDQVADRFVRMVQEHQTGEEIELAVHRDRRRSRFECTSQASMPCVQCTKMPRTCKNHIMTNG